MNAVSVRDSNSFKRTKKGTTNAYMSSISPKYGSISSIVRSYKSAVSKFAHKITPDFGWHSNYHDYVVLNKRSFDNMQRYTLNNPKNWRKKKSPL